MKIWIDIGHPAQLNFYINTIKTLSRTNNVIVTIINRGRLIKIAKKEIGDINNCTIIPLGRHTGSKISSIFDANILRLIKLYLFYLKNKPEISIGNGFLHGIISKSFNFPSIMFNDDLERKFNVRMMMIFSTELYHITGSHSKKDKNKIKYFNSLKEWAYLAPKYFHPDPTILSKYNLEKNNYIFVREVITGTLNYSYQDKNIIATIADKFPKNTKVLFSLEDKNTLHNYPNEWILLQEPVTDIHSLIYYSKLLISSGDSMAREGAILGVPSIYCGIREMKANNVLINKQRLFFKRINQVPSFIDELLIKNNIEDKELFRDKLNEEWIDVTNFIIEKINNYKNE